MRRTWSDKIRREVVTNADGTDTVRTCHADRRSIPTRTRCATRIVTCSCSRRQIGQLVGKRRRAAFLFTDVHRRGRTIYLTFAIEFWEHSHPTEPRGGSTTFRVDNIENLVPST